MKIGNPADKPPVPPVGTGKITPATVSDVKSGVQATPTVAAPISTVPDASAQVALSSTASSLLSGSSGAEFDAAKVQKFTDAIANGTFKIDAGAIADKLISNAKELLTKAGS